MQQQSGTAQPHAQTCSSCGPSPTQPTSNKVHRIANKRQPILKRSNMCMGIVHAERQYIPKCGSGTKCDTVGHANTQRATGTNGSAATVRDRDRFCALITHGFEATHFCIAKKVHESLSAVSRECVCMCGRVRSRDSAGERHTTQTCTSDEIQKYRIGRQQQQHMANRE